MCESECMQNMFHNDAAENNVGVIYDRAEPSQM